jgi:GNAT superfamily N-acetyltransferase
MGSPDDPVRTAGAIGPGELRAMQQLASEVWRIDPSYCNSDATVAELAWSWASADDDQRARWKLRLVVGDSGLLGWGWYTGPEMIRMSAESFELADAELLWQVLPGETGQIGPLLDWFDAECCGTPHATAVRVRDDGAIAVLEEHGYTSDTNAPWSALLSRSLESVEAPVLPEGYSLTSMAEFGDIEERVVVHRAAWHPSRQTTETYRQVARTWPYRADLDVVVVAPDGSLAASVLVWFDRETRAGELEPVGTHPAHRRLGLARAASLYSLKKLADLGASNAVVACRGDDNYPVPKRLYESIGFAEVARDCVYRWSGTAP